jgi:Glutaredoxin
VIQDDNQFFSAIQLCLMRLFCYSGFNTLWFEIKGDGSEIEAALHQWTEQKTVPNVFIGGKHIVV